VLQRICYPEAFYGSSGNAAHLSALRQIRGELTRLAREIHSLDPRYPSDVLRMSDQQCYACMALLYRQGLRQLMASRSRPTQPAT
jgi:hypothetical protein